MTTGLGVQSIAFSAAGQRLVYVAYAARANIWSLPIPSGGAVDHAGARPLTSGNQIVESMRVSRDGKWLLYDSTLHLNAEIFRMPVAGGPAERLTTDPGRRFRAGPVARRPRDRLPLVAIGIARHLRASRSTAGRCKPLTATPAQESYPIWSPDGSAIAFVDQGIVSGASSGTALYVMRRGPAGAWSAPVLLRTAVSATGSWLPDRDARLSRTTARSR